MWRWLKYKTNSCNFVKLQLHFFFSTYIKNYNNNIKKEKEKVTMIYSLCM